MTKQLYEEALADVKKVKQVAEDNAKRAVLEAVTPRIREFIDSALLGEPIDGEAQAEPETPPLDDELLTDLVAADPSAAVGIGNAGPAAAISPPDAAGKVTLDIDGLYGAETGTAVPPPLFGASVSIDGDEELGPGSPPGLGPQSPMGGNVAMPPGEEELEISLESLRALKPLTGRRKPTLGEAVDALAEQVSTFKKAGRIVRSSRGFRAQIAQMISRVEDMYEHVQERVSDPMRKSSYEHLLEASYKDLNKLQESESMTMSQKTKKGRVNEADLTLKLSGLPEDAVEDDALDQISVDLVTGEDEEGAGDEFGGEDDMGGDEEMDGLDFGGDQGQEGVDQMESRALSDDTIVEIDEKMLKREIARMRSLREDHSATGGSETKAQSWGNGPDHFDAFGGGKDEGEFDEQDIVDKSPAPGALPLGEADGDLDEGDDLSEVDGDEMEEAVDPNGMGGNNHQPTNKQARTPGDSAAVTRTEGLKRLSFEKKLQERAKVRASALKAEGARSRGAKLNKIKKEYALVARRFNESVERSRKFQRIVAVATKKLQEARWNSAATRPAEVKADESLRKKLAETNLFNAKLLYTNKLLQLEQLNARQKAQVIKQLDNAKTIREAKLVYESLTSTLAGSQKTMTEGADRKVFGSGSRATRPASTQSLNEGYEAERWAQLAGITKR